MSAGTKLVNQAGSAMGEVVASVKRVIDIISEITSASQEQTQGIEQINLAITQMDQVTQQNAALMEEAAAAESMENQPVKLMQAVSVFKTNGEHASAIATQTAPILKRSVAKNRR